uniref:immunoglobulin kappa variable 4-1 isoform X1 n=1 Tax=Monopterus albus TaxID=43700 RepID=UPI003D7E8E38
MMECVLVCLIFVSLSGFWGQYPAAALPASTVQVRVGENATLHCPLLDNSTSTAPTLNASSTLSWYRKVAGQSPELLLTVRSTDPSSVTYGSSVGPGKALAGANGSLLLHNSQHSDTAVYYCGISWGDQHKKPVPQQVTEK